MTALASRPSAATIAATMRRVNYLRMPPPSSRRPAHKEWLHFSATGDTADVIVNLSVFDEPSPERGQRVGRTICLVRPDRWIGALDEVGADRIRVLAQGQGLALGSTVIRFRNGGYDVRASVPDAELSVDVRFRPVTVPAQANNTALPPNGLIHWLFVPRLLASGTVRTRSQTLMLSNAPAYHDHNWGEFAWGDDFAWEWGYGTPPAHVPWSVVLVRLSNRGHTCDYARSVFVWRGARQVRLFRDDEVQVSHTGFFRASSPVRVPGLLGLLAPGDATDIPGLVIVSARSDDDHLTLQFEPSHLAQIGVPNDGDFGVTVINEVRGTMHADGQVAGELVRFSAPSLFEFLNG